MNTSILETVPSALTEIKLRPLLVVHLCSVAPLLLGRTPAHDRRVGIVTGGRFNSRHDGLNGRVLTGGNDWQTVRSDNTTTLDVRIVLETAASELIAMTYRGYRSGPPETLARLARGRRRRSFGILLPRGALL